MTPTATATAKAEDVQKAYDNAKNDDVKKALETLFPDVLKRPGFFTLKMGDRWRHRHGGSVFVYVTDDYAVAKGLGMDYDPGKNVFYSIDVHYNTLVWTNKTDSTVTKIEDTDTDTDTDKGIQHALDVIDTALSKGDEDAERLWSILTALRGPDNADLHIDGIWSKEYTKDIRTRALPKTSERVYKHEIAIGASFNARGTEHKKAVDTMKVAREDSHFVNHMNKAITALEMLRR